MHMLMSQAYVVVCRLTAITAQRIRVSHSSITKKVTRPRTNEAILIVNPSSCSGLTGKGWDELFPKIKSVLGGNPKVVFTKKGGDGTRLAREFLKKGFTRIVALGGDGTLNEVANGFFEDPTIRKRIKHAGDVSFPSPSPLRPIDSHAVMAI